MHSAVDSVLDCLHGVDALEVPDGPLIHGGAEVHGSWNSDSPLLTSISLLEESIRCTSVMGKDAVCHVIVAGSVVDPVRDWGPGAVLEHTAPEGCERGRDPETGACEGTSARS